MIPHLFAVVSTLDADAARAFIRNEHADLLSVIDECADDVVETWDGDSVETGDTVSTLLEACFDRAGVQNQLPDVLAGAVGAAGGALQAPPVAAPPYVVVTSRGPMLRATLDDGRLVVRIDVFQVTASGRYERAETTVSVAVK